MPTNHIYQLFTAIDGEFPQGIDKLENALKNIKGFVFDWDGVFNNGVKMGSSGSPFSEPDSMGTNMLRFAYWLIHGKLPFTAIVTGARNNSARAFAEREHFNGMFLDYKHKMDAFQEIERKFDIELKDLAFWYDDILDLEPASKSGLPIAVKREAGPLFAEYIRKQECCMYITGFEGGSHAVRESSEMLMGLYGNFEEVVKKRSVHHSDYVAYLDQRQSINTQFYDFEERPAIGFMKH